eukprot:6188353-Pleurochrysis_carterae.AAC.1
MGNAINSGARAVDEGISAHPIEELVHFGFRCIGIDHAQQLRESDDAIPVRVHPVEQLRALEHTQSETTACTRAHRVRNSCVHSSTHSQK